MHAEYTLVSHNEKEQHMLSAKGLREYFVITAMNTRLL